MTSTAGAFQRYIKGKNWLVLSIRFDDLVAGYQFVFKFKFYYINSRTAHKVWKYNELKHRHGE